MTRFTSFFAIAALALTVAVGSASATTITGVFNSQGIINGAEVVFFDVTTDAALNGLDFTTSGGFGFHGLFNNPGVVDADFDTVLDQFTFSPASPQPGPNQETYFPFGGVLSAQVQDPTPGPSNVLAAAISVAAGNLVPVGTSTVAIFSLVDPGSPINLGNGTPFGLAGVGVVSATGEEVPIIVIPEPASLVLLSLGLVGTFITRRRLV